MRSQERHFSAFLDSPMGQRPHKNLLASISLLKNFLIQKSICSRTRAIPIALQLLIVALKCVPTNTKKLFASSKKTLLQRKGSFSFAIHKHAKNGCGIQELNLRHTLILE